MKIENPKPGQIYRIMRAGKELGIYRLAGVEEAFCQLHGEPMGFNYFFQKLRGPGAKNPGFKNTKHVFGSQGNDEFIKLTITPK